ncbi:MAG: DNA-processing protein DprA [Solirubrobacteraceae bacterium]
MSAALDCCAHDRARLSDVLSLPDQALIDALGGRRRGELGSRYERFEPSCLSAGTDTTAVCRHCALFPPALIEDASAPVLLNVAGNWRCLSALAAEPESTPVVAMMGSRHASDYGVAMARSLARGLAASGVIVASTLQDGIPAAAIEGVIEGDGKALVVIGGGLGIGCSPRRRTLYARALRDGCAVSELPHESPGRRWCGVAGERIVAGVARLVVVIEAEATPRDMASAIRAKGLGRTVAALPGRVTSSLSAGTHALLMDGANMVRDARDVLELLDRSSGVSSDDASPASMAQARLEPRLARVLEQVGAGRDTPDRLAEHGVDAGELLLTLSELELMGLLMRGHGGRYLPRDPARAAQR